MAKRLESVAAMACLTSLLMLFNFLFWASGIAMIFVGIWMRMQMNDYSSISGTGSGAAFLGIAGLGAIVSLSAILACCCAARGHPTLLYLYGAFLGIMALLELGAGASVYAYRNSLNEKFDKTLNESIIEYMPNTTASRNIDTIQSTLHCCGNRAYTDWEELAPGKDIPKSCCSVPEDDCNTKFKNDLYTQGCYNRVMNFLNKNIGLVAGSAIGVAFFPLVGVFLACCLATNLNQAKYEQVA